MIRVIGTRGSGKTTKLLNLAQEEGYVIVEPNAMMADYVRHMATENGFNVNVIGAHELLYRQHGVTRKKYLVDELDMFLSSLGIIGYSNGSMT
jgi:broad-specificity NMP kinase